jgi:hypothetical protein
MHGLAADDEAFQPVFENYLEFFLRQRIDPRTSPGCKGKVVDGSYRLIWNRPNLEKLFLENGRIQYLISPVPDGVPRGAHPFSDSYRALIQQHVEQVIDHAKENGWYHRLGFHLPIDEPNSREKYAAVRDWAAAVKSVKDAQQLPISVTEQPKPENKDWGTLIGHVYTWIINGNYFFTESDSIESRRQAGDQIYWYELRPTLSTTQRLYRSKCGGSSHGPMDCLALPFARNSLLECGLLGGSSESVA